MSPNWKNPRRCARGGSSYQKYTNNPTVALYNAGSGAEMIAVWQVFFSIATSGNAGVGAFQGNPGGTKLTANPLVTGGMLGAGTLTQLDTATTFDLDYFMPFGVTSPPSLFADLPFVILQPGWACIVQDQNAGDNSAFSLVWEWLHPEDLEGRKCAKCNIAGV